MSHRSERLVLQVVSTQCAAEDMDDEIVALNVATGIYFSMRGLGAALWRDLAAGFAVEDLAAKVKATIGSDDAVQSFVSQMQDHGLMSEGAPRMVDGVPSIVSHLANGEREIVVDVYEDMKDLILSDPIHDADATVGWPKVATAT